MLRFLLATYGTRGDVHPMLALGRALLRRGHRVVLAGPPDFAADAVAVGVAYRGMGRPMAYFIDKIAPALRGSPYALARAIKRDIPAEMVAHATLLEELARDADRVVSASLVFVARSCADHAGLPHRFVAFAPETFPSAHHPALGERRQNLPRLFNRLSWFLGRRIDNWLLRAPINRERRRLGLPPIRDAAAHFADPGQSLLATDEELAPAPPDLSFPEPPCGAMLLPEDGPLPVEVEDFLAAGPPPVYVGFGSMPDVRPAQDRALLLDAIRRAGCRAILYAGASGGLHREATLPVLTVGNLPHGTLFARVALVVHHGGAGSTARAARAGIPQVILPHLLDQFPCAARLARRGLAPPPLIRHRLTGEALAARIREGLENQAMRDTARRLGQALAGRDGADRAAAILSASP
jgi:UDP:flavonoid glycosyltransferase YjiC (YdhE family)